MTRHAIAAGAVLLFALAGCAAQPVVAASASAAKSTPSSDTIVWKATGSDPVHDRTNETTYSLKGTDTHGATTRFGNPYSETLTMTHEPHRDLWMQAVGAPTEHMSCSITVNGAEVATSTGAGIATCAWSGQPA